MEKYVVTRHDRIYGLHAKRYTDIYKTFDDSESAMEYALAMWNQATNRRTKLVLDATFNSEYVFQCEDDIVYQMWASFKALVGIRFLSVGLVHITVSTVHPEV